MTASSGTKTSSTAKKTLEASLKRVLNIKKEQKIADKYQEFLSVEMDPNNLKYSRNIRRDLKLFRRFRLLKLLIQSIELQCAPIFSQSPYVENIIERILVTFAWKKARSLEEMNNFYREVLEVPSFTLPTEVYNKVDYDHVTAELDSAASTEEGLKIALKALSPELFVLATHGQQFFDPNVCITRSYATVTYTSKTYPNCVETSLFNFFINACRVLNQEDQIILDETIFPAGSLLREYFSHPECSTEKILEPSELQRWSDIVVEHGGIQYVRKAPKTDIKVYELCPGIVNLHNLMCILLGQDQSHFLAYDRSVRQELEEKFQQLMDLVSKPLSMLKIDFGEDVVYQDGLGDFTGTMTLLRNGSPFFQWRVTKNHSYFSAQNSSLLHWMERFNSYLYPTNWYNILNMVDPTQRPQPDGRVYNRHFSQVDPKILEIAAFTRNTFFCYVPRYMDSDAFKHLISLANFKNLDDFVTADSYLGALLTTLMRPQNGRQFQSAVFSFVSYVSRLNDDERYQELAFILPTLRSLCSEEDFWNELWQRAPKVFLITPSRSTVDWIGTTPPIDMGAACLLYEEYREIPKTPYIDKTDSLAIACLSKEAKKQYFQYVKQTKPEFKRLEISPEMLALITEYDAWNIFEHLETITFINGVILSEKLMEVMNSLDHLEQIEVDPSVRIPESFIPFLKRKKVGVIENAGFLLHQEEDRTSFFEETAKQLAFMTAHEVKLEEIMDISLITYAEAKNFIRILQHYNLDHKKYIGFERIKELVHVGVDARRMYRKHDCNNPRCSVLEKIERQLEVERIVKEIVSETVEQAMQ